MLPDVRGDEVPPTNQRFVVGAAVVGGALGLVSVIVGLVVLGLSQDNSGEVAATGLASIGATLAGGFAGWIARGRTDFGGDR
jgi:hypothetical protein